MKPASRWCRSSRSNCVTIASQGGEKPLSFAANVELNEKAWAKRASAASFSLASCETVAIISTITFPARMIRSADTSHLCALPSRKPPVSASSIGSAALAAPVHNSSIMVVRTKRSKRMASSAPSPIPPKIRTPARQVHPAATQWGAKVVGGKSGPLTSACSGHRRCAGSVRAERGEDIKSLRAGRLARPAYAQFDAPR